MEKLFYVCWGEVVHPLEINLCLLEKLFKPLRTDLCILVKINQPLLGKLPKLLKIDLSVRDRSICVGKLFIPLKINLCFLKLFTVEVVHPVGNRSIC